MNAFNPQELRKLLSLDAPCVSIYMPLHRAGKEVQQDPIRLKNLLTKAEEGLTELGMRRTEAEDMLKPAKNLLGDQEFWTHHTSSGLALFLSQGSFEQYHTPHELDELLVVNERAHVKPLLPLLVANHLFYVLALSNNAVRLLECTQHGQREVALPNHVAKSIAEAVPEKDNQTQLQHREVAPNPGNAAMLGAFHGHGGAADASNEDLLFYFRQIDEPVWQMVRDTGAPVVLAGDKSILPFYRDISGMKTLVQGDVEGNPEHVRDEELRSRAWKLVEPLVEEEQSGALERFGVAESRGLGSTNLEEIVPAAASGRVDTLFVPLDLAVWGRHEEDGKVVVHDEVKPGDEDLIDLAAIQTLMSSGRILTMSVNRVPNGGPVAAVYRY